MSLKEQALKANKEQKEGFAATRRQAKKTSLDKLIEDWPSRWRHRLDEAPPVPDRSEFALVTVTTSGHRGERKTGWMFEIDDVEFIYVDQEGINVVLVCPDCGERQADTFYGIESLGASLAKQRTLFHKCHAVAVRTLASAIREATSSTGLPAGQLYEDALRVLRR